MKHDHLSETDHPLLESVRRTQFRHAMTAPGDAVLAAVSGGPDSVALLYCLAALGPELGLNRIGVAHLHHGLRGVGADADQSFVAELAARLNLPFYTEKTDVLKNAQAVGISVEEAGRQARYRFLHDTAATHGYHKIATAHHADDNAELVLMNLLRGSGPDGLCGILPVRNNVIRPLIHASRVMILDFLSTNGMPYVEDPTNTDPAFVRNRVRHQLLPLLAKDYNPAISEALNRVAEIFQDETRWLGDLIAGLFAKAALSRETAEVVLDAVFLQRLPRAAQRRLVRMAIENVKGDLRRISFDHVEAVCLAAGRAFGMDLPDAVRVAGDDVHVIFTDATTCPPAADRRIRPFCYTLFDHGLGSAAVTIAETGATIAFDLTEREAVSGEHNADRRTALFDAEKLACPLVVRNVRPGDRFVPLGMTGSQKISDFFINEKVAPEDRAACPVVVAGGVIVWVAGHRMSELARLTPASRRVLKATLT
ncbi:MAG: tRNA lysidine(34) synthetase TilS [Thermodesulfobacteriota bacterium]